MVTPFRLMVREFLVSASVAPVRDVTTDRVVPGVPYGPENSVFRIRVTSGTPRERRIVSAFGRDISLLFTVRVALDSVATGFSAISVLCSLVVSAGNGVRAPLDVLG